MQMMTVLKPIAFDVVVCMSQLFDYYLYSVGVFWYRHSYCSSGSTYELMAYSPVSNSRDEKWLKGFHNQTIG